MNYTVVSYSIYLVLAVALTIWVARTLFRNGQAFLLEIFQKEQVLTDSVSRLLNVGIYLVSIGCGLLMIRIYQGQVFDAQTMMEVLSAKIGKFVLILGGILFFDLLVLLGLRSSAVNNR